MEKLACSTLAKKEIEKGTNPLVSDKSDKRKYNIMEWSLASVAAAIKLEVESGNLLVGQLFAAFGFLSIIWLIIRFINQRKQAN